jgi:hypothetical protein
MKDVFQLVFPHVSQFSYADYTRDFVQHAPAWILSAAAAHEQVRRFPGFDRTLAALTQRSPSCWQNPELYPPLYRLLGAGSDPTDLHRHWRALQGQLGLAEIAPDMFTHRYFRLHGPSPRTFELDNGQVREVPDAVVMADPDFPRVYRPVPHLFDDVIAKGIRYDGSSIPLSQSDMRVAITDAADVLAQYDQALSQGFRLAVGTIAITGDWRPGDRIGYSTASAFPGAIFASICTDSAPLLVETFIHEYYHQRIWLWWLIENPADLPDQDIMMISPVSGQERAVRVMMQALLIYVSLADYYHWAANMFPDDEAWIVQRSQTLRTGAYKLRGTLRKTLEGRQESLRFVHAVSEYLN